MGHGKETPRQKMIGMMYLFLTALMALNVSKDILNAFVIVNESLEATNRTFDGKNAFMYNSLEQEKVKNPAKVLPFYNGAMEVRARAKQIDDYINDVKLKITAAVQFGIPADVNNDAAFEEKVKLLLDYEYEMQLEKAATMGKDPSTIKREEINYVGLQHIATKDNYDIPTFYFCGQSVDGSAGKGKELKEQLSDFREFCYKILEDPAIQFVEKENYIQGLKDIYLGIDTRDPVDANPGKANYYNDKPEEKYWVTSKFYHLNLAAVITMLSQLQNSVKNAEAEIVGKLLGSIGSTDFKFDTLAAKINAKSDYVIQGDSYQAELFLAAFSTSQDPVIEIGSGYDSVKKELLPPIEQVPVKKGVGYLKIPASAIGERKFAALIKIKDPTGKENAYPVKFDGKSELKYTVAKPSAVVSPTKMNVLYIGVDNPVDISVSGFSSENITANISQGSLTKDAKGGYIARMKTAGTAVINVSAKDKDGTSRPMGKQEFRVKPVPDPVAKVAGSKGGPIAQNVLLAQKGVVAEMENFDFDLRVVVTEFNVSATIDGFVSNEPSTSSNFTPSQLNLIKKLRKASKLYIEDVKVKMPDGTVRKLGTISFKLQ